MSALLKTRIGTRIIVNMGLVFAIVIFVGLYNLQTISTMNAGINNIYSQSLASSQYLANADTALKNLQIDIYRDAISNNSDGMQQINTSSQEYYNQTEDNLTKYQSTGLSDEESRDLNNIQSLLTQYKDITDRIFQSSSMSTGDGMITAVRIATLEADPKARTIEEVFQNLQTLSLRQAQEARTGAGDNYGRARNATIMAILVAALLSLGLGGLLTLSISVPLGRLAQVATEIARGNLTHNVAPTDGQDEISSLSRSVHQMVTNLREFVGHIQESALVVTGSSRQLTANAQQTSAGASEAAATVTEIAGTMGQVAQSAQELAAVSDSTSREAEQGSRGVKRITSQMATIAQASDNASGVVATLSRTLDRINEIVDLITHIADQTNLLALNAAIEAARAGEQGRGFAVVAEEVRILAEQSAGAGKDINQLIATVQTESGRAVEAMAEGERQVKEGTDVIDEVGRRFQGIIGLVDDLTNRMQSLAAASQQVSTRMHTVARASEEQTAAIKEVSSATDKLAGLAGYLNQLVAGYQL